MLALETDLGRVEAVAFSPCGRFVAAGGLGVELWDLGLERVWRWGWEKTANRPQYVQDVLFHTSGSHLFALVRPGGVHQLRGSDAEEMAFITDYWGVPEHQLPAFLPVTLCVSPLDGRMATGSSRAWYGCWDKPLAHAGGRPCWTSVGGNDGASQLAFLPDGRLVRHVAMFVDEPARFTIHSPLDGSILQDSPHHVRRLDDLESSPCGRYLAGVHDYTVRVWSLAHLRRPPRVLTNGSKKLITDLAFHPGGRHLATVSNDRGVVFWDLETWQPVRGFDWHEGRMRSLAFSPDGLVAAAGSDTGHLVLFDVDV